MKYSQAVILLLILATLWFTQRPKENYCGCAA
jgi:hypothetical protein